MNITKEQSKMIVYQVQVKGQQHLSEAEQEELFRKQKKQYQEIKQLRKKEEREMKLRDFGQTSSDDDQMPVSISSRSSIHKNRFSPQQQTAKKQNQQIKVPKKQNVQKMDVYLPVKKQWIQQTLTFNENGGFSLPNYTYDIKGIRKIKIYNEVAVQNSYKVKVTYYDSNQICIGVSKQQKMIELPLHYIFFAKITKNKLVSAGIKLKEIATQKMHGAPQSIVAKAFKHGKLYKKSQVLGNWQERFIVLNKQGIYSYKSFSEKSSMFISTSQVKELWTRFQEHQDMLIIKIKHGSTKTQFGIPFVDYLQSNNWLYHFYTVLVSNK